MIVHKYIYVFDVCERYSHMTSDLLYRIDGLYRHYGYASTVMCSTNIDTTFKWQNYYQHKEKEITVKFCGCIYL